MKTSPKSFAAWLLMLALCLTLFSMAAVPTRAAGDSGIVWNESDQRYEISNYAGLLEFAAIVNGTHSSITQNKSACAILTKDIDASASAYYEINPDYAWTPIGYWNSTSDNAKYTGTFDGRGCVITGLTYNNDNTNYVGLFGYVGTDGDIKGTVQNVGLEGGSMSGSNYVGGVVGYNFGGTMENCYNTGSVTGSSNYVGGVVGYNTGNVENCYNTGGVSGSRLVGGVVGGNIDGGTVENCYNTGSITGKDYVGGVVGDNYRGTEENCYNTGSVTGNSNYVGGVVGGNTGNVENCYNTGGVSGSRLVGGVVGGNDNGTVTYCYYDTISVTIGAINGADTDTVKGLTTAQMTGGSAGNNLVFAYTAPAVSPWLFRADSEENGTYYWFYPHLKGFNFDSDGKPLSDASQIAADDWPAKVRVTVTDPAASGTVTYDGTPHTIDPTVIVNAPVIPEGAKVTYHQQTSNDWMETEGAPTDPGTYRATITEEDGNTYDTYFRILEPVLDYTVTYRVKTSEDTWSPAASVINAGDYKRVITFTNSGYGAGHAYIETEFSIAQKALTITAEDQTCTYTGNTQGEGDTSYEEPAQIAKKVTITGQLAEGDTLASITLNGQGTVVSETGYEIEPSAASIQNAAGDDVTANYDITYAKGTLTINAKPVTITADSGTKVYDGKPLTVGTCTNTALAEGHSIQSVTVTGSQTEVGSSENEPSAARIVNADGDDVTANYVITYNNGTLKVTPAPVTLTANSGSKTYSGEEQTITGFTVKDKDNNEINNLTFTGVTASGSGTNAGGYDVTFKGVTVDDTTDSSGNYVVTAVVNGTLTIDKAENPAVFTGTAVVTVGGNTVDLEGNVTGAVGTVSYTIPEDAKGCTLNGSELTSGSESGDIKVTVTVAESDNYMGTTGTITVTVTDKETVSLTVTQSGTTYGQTLTAPTYEEPVGTAATTVRYTGTKRDGSTYGPSASAPTDAGNYTVTVTCETGDTIYTGTASFTISPKAVTVNVDDQAKVYGDEDPTLTATVTGLVEGDTLNYTLTREEGEDVGTYAITVELGENLNYDVTAVGGTFTITEEAKSSCTVMWIIDDRIETETYEYGEMPIHAIPEKAPGLLYYYTFRGWNPAVRPVTGDITYTAVFERNLYPFSPFYPKPADPVTPVTPEEPETPALPFTDVGESDPFYNDVKYVYENGIMNGVSETRFDPASPLTRGMIVTILYRTEGEPDVPYAGTFDDVPSGEWYTAGVEWAASKGIVKGYGDGTYGAKDLITREQLAAILYRYAEFRGYPIRTAALSAADGGDVSGWAAENVNWAAANSILKTDGEGKIRPTEPASRAEIAAAIRAFLEGVAK